MAASPSENPTAGSGATPRRWSLKLYRRLAPAVILLPGILPAVANAQEQAPEVIRRDVVKPKKQVATPRALALLEITSAGHGTVYPIAIVIDGKFYDATAYKAAPIPFALDPGTVYEGMRAGKSEGLLTIASALHGTDAATRNNWLGKGNWLPGGAVVEKTTHKAETAPAGLESKDEPPRLSKAGAKPTANPPPAPPAKPASVPPAAPDTKSAPSKTENVPSNSGDDAPVRLRRGKPTQPLPEDKDEPHGVLQTMLAISDAGKYEPTSFEYTWDKTEQALREKQITVLAQDALRAYMKQRADDAAKGTVAPASPKKARAQKPADTPLDKTSLVARDVWRGNQPVLVYSAEADVLPPHAVNEHPDPSTGTHCFVTVVARSDIYGNLKQLFAAVTDRVHLDVTPRLEWIDAIDVDGDERGELVFREITDSTSGYVIYKPGGDSLWKMFDSLNLQ